MSEFQMREILVARGIRSCPVQTSAPTASSPPENEPVTSPNRDSKDSDSTSMVIAIVLAVIIVAAVSVGAIIYVRKNTGAADESERAGFDNPLYASESEPTSNQQTQGYMDVDVSNDPSNFDAAYADVTAPAGNTGYMDVSASEAVQDETEEDV